MVRRRRAAGVVTAVIAASLMCPAAARAHDSEQPIGCAGLYRTTWTPGLSLTTRPTTISTTEAYTCTDSSGRTSKATGSFEGKLPASCLQVNTASFREVIRYEDGRKSVIEYSANLRARLGAASLVKLQGRVVEGRAKGRGAFRSAQLLHDQLLTACLSSEGLRDGTGLAEVVIGM
jgi:hypothetical protein